AVAAGAWNPGLVPAHAVERGAIGGLGDLRSYRDGASGRRALRAAVRRLGVRRLGALLRRADHGVRRVGAGARGQAVPVALGGLGYFDPHGRLYPRGALLVLGLGVASDPVTPLTPLIAAIAGRTAGWVPLLVLLLDETAEGSANVY